MSTEWCPNPHCQWPVSRLLVEVTPPHPLSPAPLGIAPESRAILPLYGLGKSCRQSIRNLPVRLAGLAVPKANRLVEMDDRGGTSVQQEITTFVRLGCHYPSTAALTIGSIHHNGRILFTTRFSVPSFEVKAVRTPRACFLVRPQSPNLGC